MWYLRLTIRRHIFYCILYDLSNRIVGSQWVIGNESWYYTLITSCFFLSSPGEGGEFVGWQGRQSPTVSTSLSLPWGWALQLGFFLSVWCVLCDCPFCLAFISMLLEAVCILLLDRIHGCTWNLNETLMLQTAQKNMMFEWKGWLEVAVPYASNHTFATAKFDVCI